MTFHLITKYLNKRENILGLKIWFCPAHMKNATKTLLWMSGPKCIYAGSGGEYNNTKKQFNCSFLCMTDGPVLPYTGLYVLLGPSESCAH
jgi:hypothetical protein